jgi:hypothetical protein
MPSYFWGFRCDINLGTISTSQKQLVNGGEKCKVAGKEYFCFKVTIDHCPNHEEIALGMGQSQFITMFNNKSGGFRVSFDGSSSRLFVKWFDVVYSPRDLMLRC